MVINMKKIINKICIPCIAIFALELLIFVICISFITSNSYYQRQFEKYDAPTRISYVTQNGENVNFTSEDVKVIGKQLSDFFSYRADSIQVVINDKEVFSIQAVKHMQDVKDLFTRWIVVSSVIFFLFVFFIAYFILHYDELKSKAFRMTRNTYIVIGVFLLLLCIAMLINSDKTFTIFHHLIFWDKIKYRDSMFRYYSTYQELEKTYIYNYLLVNLLPLELFMSVGYILIASCMTLIVAWLLFLYFKTRNFIEKKCKNKATKKD